jgi:hypothetical protein
MDPLNDLVARAQDGDLEAFGELVRATQVMAYAVALGVLRDRSTAEDAAQEAYLRARAIASSISFIRRFSSILLSSVPKPRLVKHAIAVAGDESFSSGGTARRATHYVFQDALDTVWHSSAPRTTARSRR